MKLDIVMSTRLKLFHFGETLCNGFTGHEHLSELGIIHMNGRLYDPVLGRFLQADPIIQAPHNAQSHNRYSYVLNNPLSFTDPSGFSSWTKFRDQILKPVVAIAAAWFLGPIVAEWASFALLDAGVAVGSEIAAGNAIGAVASGFASGGIAGGNIQSALQGAFFGGLLNVGATAFGLHGAAGFGGAKHLGQTALHAAVGCAQGAAAGGSCRSGALAGGVSAFASPALKGLSNSGKYVAAAVIGGVASKLGGGKFENGALTGAFGYLLNDLNLFNRTDHVSNFREMAASLIDSKFNSSEYNVFFHAGPNYAQDALSRYIEPEALGQSIIDDPSSAGKTIRLWGCEVGRDGINGENFSQRLANATGRVVKASDMSIYYEMGKEPYAGYKVPSVSERIVPALFTWRTFRPQ